MTQENNIDFDELVFEKRNKFYGAYTLRKRYDENLLGSLSIGVAMMAAVVAIPYMASYFAGKKAGDKDVTVPTTVKVDLTEIRNDETIIEIPLEKPKMNKADDIPMSKKTVAFLTPVISDNVNQKITTIEDLDKVAPGRFTTDGGPGGFLELPEGGGGGGEIIGEDDGNTVFPPFAPLEKRPEYPGGEVAMYTFLSQNINYPERAKQMGIEGTVYIQFVVDEYGNVTKVTLARGIGGGCDEEAMRVVKNMRRWSPGRQGGHPVKVQFNLPVKFGFK